jgi:hypothetical protein
VCFGPDVDAERAVGGVRVVHEVEQPIADRDNGRAVNDVGAGDPDERAVQATRRRLCARLDALSEESP